jgi:hypothetical protein
MDIAAVSGPTMGISQRVLRKRNDMKHGGLDRSGPVTVRRQTIAAVRHGFCPEDQSVGIAALVIDCNAASIPIHDILRESY